MPWIRQATINNLTPHESYSVGNMLTMNKKQSYQELEFKFQELEKKLEFVKKKAEIADEAKLEFMSNMSHEFRTPMHAIFNYAKLGLAHCESGKRERLQYYFHQIQTSADRMMDLLSNLLALLDYDAGLIKLQLQPQDLVHIAKQSIKKFDPLLKQKRLKLEIEEPPGLNPANCDKAKMTDLFNNLLSNAIKFSPIGKKVTVEFQPVSFSGKPVAESNCSAPAIKVSIRDQGPGIPEQELEYLFKRFTQSSRTNLGCGGSGIGLAICDEIVTAHGGRIWSENAVEGGAEFSFVIPYQQA